MVSFLISTIVSHCRWVISATHAFKVVKGQKEKFIGIIFFLLACETNKIPPTCYVAYGCFYLFHLLFKGLLPTSMNTVYL